MDNALVVGGTSGLGLEIAKILSRNYEVYIAGRRDPHQRNLDFRRLDLSDISTLSKNLDILVEELPLIKLLVYASGYFQEGRIDDLEDSSILEMNSVGLIAPELLVRRVVKKQGSLGGFIAITSTSQFTPREKEPIYTGVKAGLAMLAKSLSQDKRFGRVLVAAPAGMKTPFWENSPRDMGTFLEPQWVAQRIVEAYSAPYKYAELRLLREPPRTEIKEKVD